MLFIGNIAWANLSFQELTGPAFLDISAYMTRISWEDVHQFSEIKESYYVHPIIPPVENDTFQAFSLCDPATDTLHLSAIAPAGGIWSGDCGSCVDANGVFDPTGLAPGDYLVTYQQGGIPNGSTDSFLISIFPRPMVLITGQDSADVEELVLLTASGAQNYTWTPDGSLDCDNCSNPTFTADTTTIFTVIGTDANGCSDTATTKVNIRTLIRFDMPNAFTPNGDQANDIFKPAYKGNVFKDYHLIIYSRWGERIFETYTPGEGWDGRIGDLPLESDVYVYVFEFELTNGEKDKMVDEVTLVR